MPFTWKHTDPDNSGWRDLEPARREALVFHTISTGITPVTEKNVREFYNRLSLHEATFGPLAGFPHNAITPDEARAAIGLGSNATPMTKTQFLARLNRQHLDDANRRWAKAEQAREETTDG